MKRHHIILGTKTTAGGEVISANSTRSLDGVKFALEGDKIYCPACKSEGVIRCSGPRLPESWNGIAFALEHDLCICGCKTPPTLLTAQFTSFQTVGGGGLANGAKHAASTVESSGRRGSYDEQPQLVSPPIDGMPYHVVTTDGRRFSGRTGADGLVHDEQAALTETHTPGLPYHIETNDGRVYSGRVGQDGKLPRIETYGEDQYTLHIGEEALLKQEGDAS